MFGTVLWRTFIKNNIMVSESLSKKNERFDIILSSEQKLLFEKAAYLGGYANLTDFIIGTVQNKAKEIVTKSEQVIASKKDSELFFDAIFNPDAPNKELLKASLEFEKQLN